MDGPRYVCDNASRAQSSAAGFWFLIRTLGNPRDTCAGLSFVGDWGPLLNRVGVQLTFSRPRVEGGIREPRSLGDHRGHREATGCGARPVRRQTVGRGRKGQGRCGVLHRAAEISVSSRSDSRLILWGSCPVRVSAGDHWRTNQSVCCIRPQHAVPQGLLHNESPYCPRARFSASDNASAAGTLTSGSTPVPSQSVPVTGLTKRPNGTSMKK